MRKALALLLALTLLGAACGDDDGGGGLGTDPAAASNCSELADVSINIVQAAVDSVDDMEIADFMAMDEADMPAEILRLDSFGDELEARAGVLGCTEDDAQELFCERFDQLQADGTVGELMLAGMEGACSE